MKAWLIPLIVFDLAFLPMFHLHGVPFKPGYLAIVFLFITGITSCPNRVHGLSKELFYLFVLLAMVTAVGTLVFLLFYGGDDYSLSLRATIIYLLAPMAFMVGSRDPRRWHNYIIWFILGYSVITVLFSVYHPQLGWVARFYGLEDRVGSGLYAVRSQGLFYNANISALFITMLFLYFVGGIKYGFIQAKPVATALIIAAVFATIIVLGSRGEFVAAVILSLMLAVSLVSSRRGQSTVILAIIAGGLFILFSTQLGGLAKDRIGYDPVASLLQNFSRTAHTSDPLNGVMRPVRYLEPALSRWTASPLVGTGFDSTGERPFEETSYHNDWLVVLASSGLVGLVILISIVVRLVQLDLIFLVPFLLPAMTNSFLFAPSHLLLLMVLAGMVWRRQVLKRGTVVETTVVRRNLPALGQHAHAG